MNLLDLSSKLVSEFFPFQYIEERYKIIPEPVQQRIIYYSFPRDEKYIQIYANANINLANFNIIEPLQIGFHLTSHVFSKNDSTTFHSSINFDRCKIVSVNCNCSLMKETIFWCDHVVALCLYRLKHPTQVPIRVPISETLLQMNRSQLQKCLQYLLTTHTDALQTAQNLADKLLSSDNELNSINGAPDPTAGGSKEDDNSWAFNEQQIQLQVTEFIHTQNYEEQNVIIKMLFSKIRLMTSLCDSNGIKILQIITKELTPNRIHEKSREMYEELILLWKLAIMSPKLSISERQKKYRRLLQSLGLVDLLELLDVDFSDVFSRKKLTFTLNMNALRVECLKSHGFKKQAVDLSLKILKTLKRHNSGPELETIDLENSLQVYETLREYNSDLALELGLITLGQNIKIPTTIYEQEKHLKLEEKFINLLEKYTLNSNIIEKFCMKFKQKKFSNNVPAYNFISFLIKHLSNSKLSFEVGIMGVRLTQATLFDPVRLRLEHSQGNLALTLINRSKQNPEELEILLQTISTSIRSISAVFRLAQESSETSSFSFKLGLHVLQATLNVNHRKRWDIVRFIVNSSLTCGFYQIIFLLNNWSTYFTPSEAINTLANNFLSRATTIRLSLNYIQQQQISQQTQLLAQSAIQKDPSCALNALTICESDPVSFETCYQIILEAARTKQINYQQDFTIARYMDHRGFRNRAWGLAAIAIQHLHIPFNQETHGSISDIDWACSLAVTLGEDQLDQLLPLIISNIKCASVLSEILKRAMLEPLPPPRKCSSSSQHRLKLLIEATISSYISTIHNRLTHISPRHYSDFLEYLAKARESFLYANDGIEQFNNLIANIKTQYKGKKKLTLLLHQRFVQ